MSDNRFLFIVGTGRCGTQMLRKVLNCCPDIRVLPETHFIPTLYDKFGLGEIGFDDFYEVVNETYCYSGSRWILTILNDAGKACDVFYEEFKGYTEANIERRDIRGYVKCFCAYLYGQRALYADKTPHYGTELVLLKNIWPEAKFIHMVRDGVDCARSMIRHPGFVRNISGSVAPNQIGRLKYRGANLNLPDTPVSLEAALKFWEALFLATQEQIQKIDSRDVLTVRYEDLVIYPAAEIKRIVRFLGFSEDDKWIGKAICHPRPFSEKLRTGRLCKDEYSRYYNIVKDSMKSASYPYKFEIDRGFAGSIKEFWRGRNFYINKMNPFVLARKLKRKQF